MKTGSFAFLIVAVFAAEAFAEKRDVSFTAQDGVALKGSFYSAPKAGPGVLLLHQCNADHRVYDNLATMLSAAGYNVLAFDFRGLGTIADKMAGDVEAAYGFLTSQPGVNSRAIGVVGGSCGANQAVHAARRHPEIRTLVLLSGGTDVEGEAFIKGAPNLPILGVASEEDTDAAALTLKLVSASPSSYSRMDMFKAAGHAASMFERQPDLEADIVIWFRKNLAIGGYGLPPAIR